MARACITIEFLLKNSAGTSLGNGTTTSAKISSDWAVTARFSIF